MTALGWGRRYLMCPPLHFGVLYEINPWMHREVAVDRDRSVEQWERLVGTLRAAGAEVETLEPHEHVPDLVFTANAGLLDAPRKVFVPSNFRHPERQPETAVFADWFAGHGWTVEPLPDELDHEGAGDALPFGGVLLSGYRPRSDAAAGPVISRLLDVPVRTVELVDERLYHVDLTFCPLDDRHALCAPLGWDRYGRKVVDALVPEPLWLEDDEALAFCANSVVVGNTIVMPSTPPRVGRQLEAWGFSVVVGSTIVMPSTPPRVGRQLEAWGFTVVESRVDEFLKAGGGCRCLTLALDVALRGESERD